MRTRIPCLVALVLAVSLGACASTNGKIATAVTQATLASQNLHCGTKGAPAPPLCLTDGQFKQVNVDLAKISQAQLDYIQIVQAATAAKAQPPVSAAVAFIGVISQAMTDIAQLAGTSTDVLLNDLKGLLGKL